MPDGPALFDACPSPSNTLPKIPDANRNDIQAIAFGDFAAAIQRHTAVLLPFSP